MCKYATAIAIIRVYVVVCLRYNLLLCVFAGQVCALLGTCRITAAPTVYTAAAVVILRTCQHWTRTFAKHINKHNLKYA